MKRIYRKPDIRVAYIEMEMPLNASNEEITIREGEVDDPLRVQSKKMVLDWDE